MCIKRFLLLLLHFSSAAFAQGSLDTDACVKRIRTLREGGISRELARVSSICARRFPKNDLLLHLRALVLLEARKPGRAVVPLRHAITLRPEVPDNYLVLLRAYLESNDELQRWNRVLRKLSSKFPNSPEILLNAGNLLIHYQKFRSALEFWNHIFNEGLIEKWIYHLKLGQMYLLIGRFEDARKDLEVSIQENPDSAITLYYLGRLFEKTGNQSFMLSYFQHALQKGLEGEPRTYVKNAVSNLNKNKETKDLD